MSSDDRGCVRIDVTLSPSAVLPEFICKPRKKECCKIYQYSRNLWEFAKEDKDRVAFSLKVGLAMIIVSLLILISQPYEVFGTNIAYSILTVAVMFEYTVGATLNRGFNRAAGTLVAGVCSLIVIQIIILSAHAAEPYIIGVSIFLVAIVTSFIKQWPPLVPYEQSFRVTLFTYCLLIVSTYRNSNPVVTALTRLYCIAIGALIAVLVNVLLFPMWAGDQLHKELAASFQGVADSLEECVQKYLSCSGSEQFGSSQCFTDGFPNEPSFQNCRAIMNSSARIDFLANSAKWELPHGRFRLFYPWLHYVKVGSVLRHCACEVMALHGCLHSEIQAIYCMKQVAEPEIRKVASGAKELLCHLAKNLSNMKHNPIETTNMLRSVHSSVYQLEQSIQLNSVLFATLRTGILQNYKTNAYAKASLKSEECIESVRRNEARRLHSCPSINPHQKDDGEKVDPYKSFWRTECSKNMEALSFTAFISLLIEFVARLDHLVNAVHELCKLAKFEEERMV